MGFAAFELAHVPWALRALAQDQGGPSKGGFLNTRLSS